MGYAVRSDEAYENSIGCLPTASSNQLQHMINYPLLLQIAYIQLQHIITF